MSSESHENWRISYDTLTLLLWNIEYFSIAVALLIMPLKFFKILNSHKWWRNCYFLFEVVVLAPVSSPRGWLSWASIGRIQVLQEPMNNLIIVWPLSLFGSEMFTVLLKSFLNYASGPQACKPLNDVLLNWFFTMEAARMYSTTIKPERSPWKNLKIL